MRETRRQKVDNTPSSVPDKVKKAAPVTQTGQKWVSPGAQASSERTPIRKEMPKPFRIW